MYRTVPYIVLFLILALLQIFLFDNLSISIYLCPLVYIGFIVLLPIDAPPVAVLFLALSMSEQYLHCKLRGWRKVFHNKFDER